MKVQEIYQVHYTITDRDTSWAAKPIETNEKDAKRAVKKYLNKWSYAMDLSTKYKFSITKVSKVGYGTL